MADSELPRLTRTFTTPHPTDLRLTLGQLKRGRGDPTMALETDGFWRATRTPDGPATMRITKTSASVFAVEAWGSGAQWVADRAPVLLGANDDLDAFPDHHEGVLRLHHAFRHWRTPCTQAVFEVLFPVVLEQKVTGKEARSSYARLARLLGEPAPQPDRRAPRLLLPPSPAVVAGTPTHVFHQANVERKRSDTIKRAATYGHRLEPLGDQTAEAAREALRCLPGIGEWSVAEILTLAFGDNDAVSVGDYHVKNWVSWNLAGEPRGSDEFMLELLEPFRPFRGRVARLLQLGGSPPPRYGPRITIQKRW